MSPRRIACFFFPIFLFSCLDNHTERDSPTDPYGSNWKPPTVSLSSIATDSLYPTNEALTFRASGTDNGSVEAYQWCVDTCASWSDWNAADSIQQTWTNGGTHWLRVRVRDNDGVISKIDSLAVQLNQAPVLGSLVASATSIGFTETITLTGPTITDVDSNAVDSLWWDLDGDGAFDDAATLTGATVRDSFPDTAGGIYVVSVRGKDTYGLYDTASVRITVAANQPPVLGSLVASDSTLVFTQTITLTGSSITDVDSNAVDSLWWDLDGDGAFDDAATLTGVTVRDSFPDATGGTYVVSVRGMDTYGLYDTASVTITVLDTISYFMDSRDEQIYKIVTIGTQTWMAQNLNYSGDDGAGNRAYTTGWCYGVGPGDTTDHSDSSTCNTYGRFYNWTSAMAISETYLGTTWGSSDTVKHQGICPEGWHVPTNTEWSTLADYLGGSDTAGFFLKSTSGWSSDGNGSDAYGFSALPAGYRYSNGVWYNQGGSAYFWSASEYSATYARYRFLGYYNADLDADYNSKYYGFSLRCTKD